MRQNGEYNALFATIRGITALSSYALQIVGRGCGGEHLVHAWDVRLTAKIHGIVELGDAGADSFVAACYRIEGVTHRHIVGHGQHKGELLV